MKKLIIALIFLLVMTVFSYSYLKYEWRTFEDQPIVGTQMTIEGDNLEEVAMEFLKVYGDQYKGITVPYSHRLKSVEKKSIEVLDRDKGYVQIDFFVRPVSENSYIHLNFTDLIFEEEGIYLQQAVLKLEATNNRYKVVETMRPVQYQIKSDPYLQTDGKDRTTYKVPIKDVDYLVNKGKLYITYDKGETRKEVPVDYKKVTYDPMSSLNDTIPEGSYIVSEEYVGFLYVEDGLKLIYSYDQGNTWDTTIVANKGYYRARYLFKTEQYYSVLYATDKTMSAEGHALVRSVDGVNFTPAPYHDPEVRLMTYAYFINDHIGYVAYKTNEPGNSRSFYRTEDGGQTFTQINFELEEINTFGDYIYTPFIEVNKIYEENGQIHLIVGQGENGDYGHYLGHYVSDDGINFEYLEQITLSSREAG